MEPEGPGKIYINYRYYKQRWNDKYNPRRQIMSLVLNATTKDQLTEVLVPANIREKYDQFLS